MAALFLLVAAEAVAIFWLLIKRQQHQERERELRDRLEAALELLRANRQRFKELRSSDTRIVDRLMREGRKEAERLENYFRRSP
jgi:hypothetical protein